MTTWYDLDNGTPASVKDAKGKWVTGVEFEVSCGATILLSRCKAPDAMLTLAREVHGALQTVTQELRYKVATMTDAFPHVVVLVRYPLTVHASDVPPRMLTEPCEACPSCLQGEWCEDRRMIMNEDGTPMTLPGTLGYHAFVTVAVVGSPEPLTCPHEEASVISDAEPWWMVIPPLDEGLPGTIQNRHELIHAMLPQPPPEPWALQ